MRKHKIQKYGWIKDSYDQRDLVFGEAFFGIIPSFVDLRKSMPPVYNQGELGSCTANAIAGAIQFLHKDLMPSRLFIYYNEREIEGTVNSDSGAQIRDGVKSVVGLGVCSETDWPYDISNFAEKPQPRAYTDALKGKITQYHRIIGLNAMKHCLAIGFPFVFGIPVYESFESEEVTKTGIVPMPKDDESPLGGHCMLAIGFRDSDKNFIVRNSWGNSWAESGYCFIPYDYLTSYGSDAWVIRH